MRKFDFENLQNAMSPLNSVPVIREGDNIFILGKLPSMYDMQRSMNEFLMNKSILALDEYRCPFDFIDEHDQWFEWKRREHFDRESTGKIITSMLDDLDRIKDHKVERRTYKDSLMFESMYDSFISEHTNRMRGVVLNSFC